MIETVNAIAPPTAIAGGTCSTSTILNNLS